MFTVMEGDQTYDWPVTVRKPVDGGKFAEERFTAQFRVAPQERIDEILTTGRVDAGERDLLAEVLVGWKDVGSENGDAFPVSDQNKAALIGIPYVRVALMKAYLESVSGGAFRQKN